MEKIMEYLPFIIPLLAVQLVLAIVSLIHVLKHPNYRFGNKLIWIIAVLFVSIFGPIIYFVFGRGDE
jgi:hypothetical protein